MPPVRWKILVQIIQLSILLQIAKCDVLQDSLSITSNGWRPIVGKSQRDVNDEITLYKNPSGTGPDSKPVKAQTIQYHTPPPTQPTKLYQTIPSSEGEVTVLPTSRKGSVKNPKKIQGSKTPQHVKIQQPIVLIPKFPILGHGPHIPLTSSRRHPIVNVHQTSKRKPMRGSSSLKNEIFLPASSSGLGSYSFFTQSHGPPPRVRDSGQNYPSGKHFHFLQPQYGNQFGATGTSGTNDVIIQQVPVRTLLIQNKYPNQNDGNRFVKNDEYAKNLVPPPYSFIHQDSKPTDFNVQDNFKTDFGHHESLKPTETKQNEHTEPNDESINNSLHLVVGKYKDHRNRRPEKNNVQGPPHFEDKNKFNTYHQSNDDDDEVQITKEKLKTYHNIPLSFNYDEEDSFDFSSNKKPLDKTKTQVAESYSHIQNYNQDPKPTRSRIPIRESFLVYEEPKRERGKKPSSSAPNYATYEVTEGKHWQVFQPYLSTKPSYLHNPASSQFTPTLPQHQIEHTAFLPTPYHPDNSVPTSPTQEEISSIYTELNKKHNFKHERPDDEQDFFNIREVSTHYPIVNKLEYPTVNTVPVNTENIESFNEVSTGRPEKRKPVENTTPEEEPATPKPSRKPQGHRTRNPSRRRKPQFPRTTSTTTTTTTTTTTEEPPPINTESYEINREEQYEETTETPKPRRTRKPLRIRTTEPTIVETTTKEEFITVPVENIKPKYKIRYEGNRLRPTPIVDNVEEVPFYHKVEEVEHVEYEPSYEYKTEATDSYTPRPTTEDLSTNYENYVVNSEQSVNVVPTEELLKIATNSKQRPVEPEEPSRYTQDPPQTYTDNYAIQEVSTTFRRKHRFSTTTTEYPPTINIITPENEIETDYASNSNRYEAPKETTTNHVEYTRATTNPRARSSSTSTTTSTTTAETPTKSNRIRGRPAKYDNKNRPRFSVKEYRERLNQHSSTTTDSPASPRASTESARLRFPNRTRKPLTNQDNGTTTERSKFTPKEPRHNTAINPETAATERKVNTRLRPFGNSRRSTTEASPTQKLSIKPNIFSSLRRPSQVSLKSRILNKHNRTNTEEKSTEKSQVITETTPESTSNEVQLTEKKYVELEEESEELKNDGFLLSQRISNLTSSAQNDYDTPGLFKAVSPNTRKVPSYFTISTDDPILPIEAFFPNLKEKTNKSDN